MENILKFLDKTCFVFFLYFLNEFLYPRPQFAKGHTLRAVVERVSHGASIHLYVTLS